MALSPTRSIADSRGHELVDHGTAAFPVACYDNDLSQVTVPWHWHDEMEVAVIQEGSLVLAVGSRRHTLRVGQGFFLNTGVLHSCWDEMHTCRCHSVVFSPRLVGGSLDSVIYQTYLQPLLDNRGFEEWILSPEVTWQAECLCQIRKAWQSCAMEPYGFEIRTRNALSELILGFFPRVPSLPKDRGGKAQRDEKRMKTMLRFLQANLSEPISLSQIAESAAISPSECIRCFHSTIGVTPIQYLREYRIRHGAALLRETQMPIAEVCAQCGFGDLSYFTKTFRQIVGTTPGEYRHQNREIAEKQG